MCVCCACATPAPHRKRSPCAGTQHPHIWHQNAAHDATQCELGLSQPMVLHLHQVSTAVTYCTLSSQHFSIRTQRTVSASFVPRRENTSCSRRKDVNLSENFTLGERRSSMGAVTRTCAVPTVRDVSVGKVTCRGRVRGGGGSLEWVRGGVGSGSPRGTAATKMLSLLLAVSTKFCHFCACKWSNRTLKERGGAAPWLIVDQPQITCYPEKQASSGVDRKETFW